MVPIEKMGAWYLLMLLSFVLVSLVHKPERADSFMDRRRLAGMRTDWQNTAPASEDAGGP
jgi:hypothetical protein